MFRAARIWLPIFLFLCLCCANLVAQTEAPKEYALKAVFLLNFARFVEWPSAVFEDSLSPLVVGVLGDDPFGTCLDETIKGERIKSRPMAVKRFHDITEVRDCQILFISSSEANRIHTIVSNLKGRSILTVGDTEGFAKKGVMIRFVTVANKVKLKINVDVAKTAGLSISSKLLRLADIVSAGE